MKFDPYSLTELIRNDEFIAWVRHPDSASEAQWRQFLADFPEKRKVVEDARGYVDLLAEDTGKHRPTIEQSTKMWRVVESQLHAENVEDHLPEKIVSGWRWIRIAASIALILGIASGSYWYLSKQKIAGQQIGIVHSTLKDPAEKIVKINNSSAPMTILLADGSSVVLHPGGQLSYSAKSNVKKREVSLVGKAFFEIVKDAKRPFLVYTGGLATKVLGTSFSIDAPIDSEDIKVEVKTGKVSVFALSANPSSGELEEAGKAELRGIILKRDQKMAISRQNGKPVIMPENNVEINFAGDIANQLFLFDETPVSEVFSALESAYNIKILYDKTLLGNCPLNATLIGQPFIEKLSVICVALDAQYELKNNQVIITGKGCK